VSVHSIANVIYWITAGYVLITLFALLGHILMDWLDNVNYPFSIMLRITVIIQIIAGIVYYKS